MSNDVQVIYKTKQNPSIGSLLGIKRQDSLVELPQELKIKKMKTHFTPVSALDKPGTDSESKPRRETR